MLVVSIVIVSCLCRRQCYQLESQGVPSVTYPRATWRLQAEQEAVPVCEKKKTELFCV